MEWVIVLTIALVVYVFVVRRRGRDALADNVAHGGAGGARRATYGYFRRRDRIWRSRWPVRVCHRLRTPSRGPNSRHLHTVGRSRGA